MLKLIMGPAGAGKTDLLIDKIRADIEACRKCFLILPEQQGYIAERDLPARLPKNAGLYFEVVNFSRLAEKVFQAYGGTNTPPVNNGIRTLLMWNTLRTLSPMLSQYASAAKGDMTLANLMMAGINELRAGGITGEELEKAAASLPEASSLRKKLLDLALVDATFRHTLESTFGSDPADALLRMHATLEAQNFFSSTHIYIDSFTDFTVPEYQILGDMLRQAEDVTITLCCDGQRTGASHFDTVRETARRLEKAANQADVKIQKTVLPPRTDKKAPILALLERQIWDFSCKRQKSDALPERTPIRLLSASNVYEEAEAAALQISEWAMDGIRYGEMAVIVRDTETYRGILDAVLERHGIPYFLSERTDLSSKSVFRLILSALRAVSRNYRQADIITLIKTGLCGVELSDAAMFEEYCETWHIGGKRFFDEVWSMNPDGLTTERSPRAECILEGANRVRRIVMEPLGALAADLRTSARLYDRCRALYNYFVRIDLSARLSQRAKEELSKGQKREANETVRLYRLILEILSSLCKLLPNEEMTVDEWINALTILFSNSDLGSVPGSVDCVTIGSASTLRVENIRASLLLGLCEGEFPKALHDEGILTEGDKNVLEELGISLDSRESRRSSEELFYVYRAMTKPTERLSLFTVLQQTDGSARTPSLAFSRVRFLFDLPTFSFDLEAWQAAESMQKPERFVPVLSTAPSTSPLTLTLSQSKIQAFVLCPYRYYSTYTLKLREAKDSTPSYADDGIFLHYIFEHFLRRALNGDGTLHLPHETEIEDMADAIIDDYIREICPFSPDRMDARLLHLYARLRKLAVSMLHDMLFELKEGAFVPSRFEQIIGMPGENGLPPVTLTLKDGSTVKLSGKIDRVDCYRENEKTYIRVVDYKSGKHTFSPEDVRSGMDIQLVLYLTAALAAIPDSVGAGAHFLYSENVKGSIELHRRGYYLDDEYVLKAANGTGGACYTQKLLAQTAEEIAKLEQDMKDAVTEIAGRILSGEAEKTPSRDACTFCPVRAHCDKAYHK